MGKRDFYFELEDIHYKYERLTSLICIMQMFVADVVEIAGTPADCLNNSLFEIEKQMDENNNRLKELFRKKGGAA